MTNTYDTRILDEINQIKTEHLDMRMSYVLMNNVSYLMEQYKSNIKTNTNLNIKDNLPQKALEAIVCFANKTPALNDPLYSNPANSNADSYIAYDLARATASIPPETPELSLKLLTTTKSLYDKTRGINPESQIEDLSKVCRYTGDSKVATAFLDTTQDLFEKTNNRYGFSDNTLQALGAYKDIATLHPNLASRCLDTAILLAEKIETGYNKKPVIEIMQAVANNPNTSQELRDKAKNAIDRHQQKQQQSLNVAQTTAEQMSTTQKGKKTIDQNKALDFIKKGKAYAGGQKLFEHIKNSLQKEFEKNAKLYTFGGLAAMIAGCQTLQPQLAAAGASIMTAGLIAWRKKSLEKKISQQGLTNLKEPKQTRSAAFANHKGIKYDGR